MSLWNRLKVRIGLTKLSVKPPSPEEMLEAQRADLESNKTPDQAIINAGLKLETDDPSNGVTAAIGRAMEPNPGTYDIALHFLGKDDRKAEDAFVLSEFIKKATGVVINVKTTAWCAAFANAVLGVQDISGTGKLTARSFLNWGQEVTEPVKGDIVVLWRESRKSWKGHVGFFDRFIYKNGTKFVRMLGGNQEQAAIVALNDYPISRVLGYRRPKNLAYL